MHAARRKSLVAGAVVLLIPIKDMFSQSRFSVNPIHVFNLVLCPAACVLCFWHAFRGRKPLLGTSEFYTSVFLGALSLLSAFAPSLAWLIRGHHRSPLQALTAAVLCAAAIFFFVQARQERRMEPTSS